MLLFFLDFESDVLFFFFLRSGPALSFACFVRSFGFAVFLFRFGFVNPVLLVFVIYSESSEAAH